MAENVVVVGLFDGGEIQVVYAIAVAPAGDPLVTVIAVCYNHARFLKQTLDSIQEQTYSPIQLIIVDDASMDESRDLIRSWVRENVSDAKLMFNDRNLGLCASLNRALACAEGKYVASVATDDIWLPKKIAVQVARMETLPGHVGVVYSDAAEIDEEGAPVRDSVIDNWGFVERPEGDLFLQLLERNPIPAPTALVRRSCFETVGVYDEAFSFEDLDMWLRIARSFHFAYVPEILAIYREVATSLSRNTKFWEGHVRIYLKWLGTTPESDLVLRRKIPELVWSLYRDGDENVPRYAGMSMRLAPNPRTVALYVFVRLGIRHAHLRALKRRIRAVVPRTLADDAEDRGGELPRSERTW